MSRGYIGRRNNTGDPRPAFSVNGWLFFY